MITTKDIAWFAGFYEGEAYVVCTKTQSISIEICQVNKEPLIKCMELFGGFIGFKRGKTHFQVYRWILKGHQAFGLLMTIYSLLSERRKSQVKKVFDVHKHKSSYRIRGFNR